METRGINKEKTTKKKEIKTIKSKFCPAKEGSNFGSLFFLIKLFLFAKENLKCYTENYLIATFGLIANQTAEKCRKP